MVEPDVVDGLEIIVVTKVRAGVDSVEMAVEIARAPRFGYSNDTMAAATTITTPTTMAIVPNAVLRGIGRHDA